MLLAGTSHDPPDGEVNRNDFIVLHLLLHTNTMTYSTQTAWQSKGHIKSLQEQKLTETLLYLQEKSPFYRQLFASHTISVHQVKTLEDLRQIPVTTKEDLQQQNDDFLCVPKNKIIEYTSTSGTLGSPVTM